MIISITSPKKRRVYRGRYFGFNGGGILLSTFLFLNCIGLFKIIY
jgi:hypothetical protein